MDCFSIREVATISYRSGPEWELRFGRKRIDDPPTISPDLCPEFEIESYLDYQVRLLLHAKAKKKLKLMSGIREKQPNL